MRRLSPVLIVLLFAAGCGQTPTPPPPPVTPISDLVLQPNMLAGQPLRLASGHRLTVWWDELPVGVQVRAAPAGGKSNIHPADYAGPDVCRRCHAENHRAWSEHPHRWMNALAGPETVRGDFSGKTGIAYNGGQATFETRGGEYRMRLERNGVRREYRITQTIGVRFFQYYVGRMISGPEPAGHHFYQKDHVLPFGYWLSQHEWVPVVHIGPELAEEDRPDPFNPPDHGAHFAEYSISCNSCHTTFSLGDLFARRPHQMGVHAPVSLHWSVQGFMKESHPSELEAMTRLFTSPQGGTSRENPMARWEAARYAVTLGVSCEACHLGGREHVESQGVIPPRFFPDSPYLSVEGRERPAPGRTHDNLNWACGRCHTGGRPAFAAGMSTWNSVEYADAVRGSCYSKLRCTDCHDPHRATGPTWTVRPERDDAVCLKCHDRFQAADRRAAHTHHPAGSDGDRCLNCHMPRINEGLQDVVRTHMIYSPTRPDMIQANHPNACNLCHTDRPIDWTLGHLKDWYGKSFDGGAIQAHYPARGGPVAEGWLDSPDESVRLVAADALARAGNPRVIPRLLDALDDPYLLNRQFAARGLEVRLGIRAADSGYRFYLSKDERRGPLTAMRTKLAPNTTPKQPPRKPKPQIPADAEPR